MVRSDPASSTSSGKRCPEPASHQELQTACPQLRMNQDGLLWDEEQDAKVLAYELDSVTTAELAGSRCSLEKATSILEETTLEATTLVAAEREPTMVYLPPLATSTDKDFLHDQQLEGSQDGLPSSSHFQHCARNRMGSVWLGQRSVSPTESRDEATAVSSSFEDNLRQLSQPVGPAGDSLEADSALVDGVGRLPNSVRRSRIAGGLCLLSVGLLVLSCALPKWLVREPNVLHASTPKERFSAGVSMGLFTICEDTMTGNCHAYINGNVDAPLKDLLWDVPIDDCRDFYRATCICALLASLLGSVAAFFNFAAPRLDMFKYHMAIFVLTMVTVVFTSTSMVCWFVWSGKDLRRVYSEDDTFSGKRIGGRFSLGLCFYFMFVSSFLMTVAGKLVLYEMFVTSKREKEELTKAQAALVVHDAEDFSSAIIPMSSGATVFTNTHFLPAQDSDSERSLRVDDHASETPPPAYGQVEMSGHTVLCMATASESGLTVQSSQMSLGDTTRVPSPGDASCASSMWRSARSEGGTPHHLLGPGSSMNGTLPRNFKPAQEREQRDQATPLGKSARRFLDRRRWSTVTNGPEPQRRSYSSSELDVISNYSARHLDEDVTTYSVVPNTAASSQKRRSRHSIIGSVSQLDHPRQTPSPNLSIGCLDFDFSLCRNNFQFLAESPLGQPCPATTTTLGRTASAGDEHCRSDCSTPVAEWQDIFSSLSNHNLDENQPGPGMEASEDVEFEATLPSTKQTILQDVGFTYETDF